MRKMYEIAYWICDNCAPSGSQVFRGFYTRFKKPSEVADRDLATSLKELLTEADKD